MQQEALKVLGIAVRKARLEKGLTQQQLAYACGCDATYISMIESGKRNPPFLTLYRISAQLGQPLAKLLRAL